MINVNTGKKIKASPNLILHLVVGYQLLDSLNTFACLVVKFPKQKYLMFCTEQISASTSTQVF